MPGTYRPVQCAQKIGRSWALILEGEYVVDIACSPSGLSCSPTLFNRLAGTTEYVLYNNGVEDPQRYGWVTDRGIMASNFRHLTGCEDGTGTFCCYGKSRRQSQIAHWPRAPDRTQAHASACQYEQGDADCLTATIECEETFEFCMSVC